MFICSVKASTLRFFGIVALSLTVLLGMTLIGVQGETATGAALSVSYDGIRTETDRRAFLSAFGYEAEDNAKSTVEYTLPKALDAVLLAYNELQKEQGLDLSKYTGKTVTRYTYEIKNYEGYEGAVYANLIVYRNKIVGADLSGVGDTPFVKALTARETDNGGGF